MEAIIIPNWGYCNELNKHLVLCKINEQCSLMQTLKDTTRYQILTAAEKLFHKKGFTGTSMREIAADSNIGLGNIYNYFKNKDDIFRAIVQPSLIKLMQMFDKNHSHDSMDIMLMASGKYLEETVNEHVSLIISNRNSYKLLFLKSKDSSFELFKEEFTDYATQKSKQYLIDMKLKHPEIDMDISDFFIHLTVSGMFNLFEELLMHKITKKDIKPIIQEYMRFNIAGWRELTRV